MRLLPPSVNNTFNMGAITPLLTTMLVMHNMTTTTTIVTPIVDFGADMIQRPTITPILPTMNNMTTTTTVKPIYDLDVYNSTSSDVSMVGLDSIDTAGFTFIGVMFLLAMTLVLCIRFCLRRRERLRAAYCTYNSTPNVRSIGWNGRFEPTLFPIEDVEANGDSNSASYAEPLMLLDGPCGDTVPVLLRPSSSVVVDLNHLVNEIHPPPPQKFLTL